MSQKIKDALSKLKTGKSEVIISGINDLRESGNLDHISPVIEVLKHCPIEEVHNEVMHFLFDLKNPEAIRIIINYINDPDYAEFQRLLVSACWEANIDCSSYLNYFVDLAIVSDYVISFEALTVIENMNNTFTLEELNEAIAKVKEATDADEDGKFDLLHSLWEVLVEFRAFKLTSEN